MLRIAGVVALLAGCHNFDSVDDACKDSVRGDGKASDEAIEIIGRIQCYRRYAGVERPNIDPWVSDAVVAHASYLEQNQVISDGGDWTLEEPGQPGYTGATSYDRLTTAQYVFPQTTISLFVWEVLLPVDPVRTRAELIDETMHDPFARDVLLAPGWKGSGYAEGEDALVGPFAYLNVALYFPSGTHAQTPIAYPVDGQAGVPTAWENPYVGLPDLSQVPAVTGYPITFTVGSSQPGDFSSSNPLDLAVESSVITGPDGIAVEHVLALPGAYPFGVDWSTAVLFPTAPLSPNATYTVEATLSWLGQNHREVSVEFTTGT